MTSEAYLLDTDYVIDFLKGKPYASETYKQVLNKAEIAISIITYAEVYEGIFYGRDREQHEANFLGFTNQIMIYGLTPSIAKQYAIIRGNLRSNKATKDLAEPKKYYDLFIATTALEYGLTLVTNNVKDSEPSSPLLPEQQEFQQHLRTLAQSAVRTVIELVMREELDAFIGAAWGECSVKRKGYRNGTYTRDLVTSTGRLEDIKVPRDREGEFHTQAFERYRRYEPHIAEGLTQMFVAGTSTHKVGEVAQTLMGVAPSASTISRLNQTLTQQFEMWRQRSLQAHWRVLYLDGVQFSIRHGDKVDSTIILTALGVDLEGNKEVLALRACAQEDKDGWACLLQDLRRRGATHIDLIVTDGHDGLLAAVSELFSATPRQRCLVHKQRNVLNAIPRRERGDVQAELVGIWEQPNKQEALTQLAAFKAKYTQRYPEAVRSLAEDEEHLLTFYQFPQAMHRHIQTTNAIESLFSNVRQRTDQIDVFTTETSCLTIVWATIQDIRLHKISVQ